MTSPPRISLHPSYTRDEAIAQMEQAHITLPGPQEAEQYEHDKEWLKNHRRELLAEYEEMWVAVYGGQVIESHRNLDKLVESLTEQAIETTGVVIEYITDREFLMLL